MRRVKSYSKLKGRFSGNPESRSESWSQVTFQGFSSKRGLSFAVKGPRKKAMGGGFGGGGSGQVLPENPRGGSPSREGGGVGKVCTGNLEDLP